MHADVDRVVDVLRQRVVQLLHGLDRLEVVEVHLPVAGDERRRITPRPGRAFGAARSAASPAGRRARAARGSRHRRWTRGRRRRRARTRASAAAESPPPTTVNAFVSAIACATVRVPAAKRSSSNIPIGPFQNTVRASMITSLNAAAEPGPMSNPCAPSGSVGARTSRTSPSASTPTMSSGRWIVLP